MDKVKSTDNKGYKYLISFTCSNLQKPESIIFLFRIITALDEEEASNLIDNQKYYIQGKFISLSEKESINIRLDVFDDKTIEIREYFYQRTYRYSGKLKKKEKDLYSRSFFITSSISFYTFLAVFNRTVFLVILEYRHPHGRQPHRSILQTGPWPDGHSVRYFLRLSNLPVNHIIHKFSF